MKAQIQNIETGTTNSIEKVLVITIKPLNITEKIKSFLQKVNANLEVLGTAASLAIRS